MYGIVILDHLVIMAIMDKVHSCRTC